MCKTELPPTPDVNPEEARIGWEHRNPRVAWCPTAGELTPESRDTFPNRTGELGGGLPGLSRPDPRPQQQREEPGPHGASLRPNSPGEQPLASVTVALLPYHLPQPCPGCLPLQQVPMGRGPPTTPMEAESARRQHGHWGS